MDNYSNLLNDNDFRWQQEIEHERFIRIQHALGRVAAGTSTLADAELLAAETGVPLSTPARETL